MRSGFVFFLVLLAVVTGPPLLIVGLRAWLGVS